MKLKQARVAAKKWMVEEGIRIPGVCGAYTAGSSNWLPDTADLATGSDLDIMVVLTDPSQTDRRRKFIYRDTLLEVSYLRKDQSQSPKQVLSDYHLAPSFRTTRVMFDPLGHLSPLLVVVSREYAKRPWVVQRCTNAKDKILTYLNSVNEQTALYDQVLTCLFAAGITTHVLLVAGLKNPTVRARYVRVRELLAEYGRLEFQERLLGLLGVAAIRRERVSQHLAALTRMFDAAKAVLKTPFVFASDISETSRTSAIDSSLELIASGYHREAMFWIGITYCRCMKVLSMDAPRDLTRSFNDSYQELVSDLGVPSFAKVRQRRAEIRRILPGLAEMSEEIMAANHKIVDNQKRR